MAFPDTGTFPGGLQEFVARSLLIPTINVGSRGLGGLQPLLSPLVRKQLMQISAMLMTLDLHLRYFEDFSNGRVVSTRPL